MGIWACELERGFRLNPYLGDSIFFFFVVGRDGDESMQTLRPLYVASVRLKERVDGVRG